MEARQSVGFQVYLCQPPCQPSLYAPIQLTVGLSTWHILRATDCSIFSICAITQSRQPLQLMHPHLVQSDQLTINPIAFSPLCTLRSTNRSVLSACVTNRGQTA